MFFFGGGGGGVSFSTLVVTLAPEGLRAPAGEAVPPCLGSGCYVLGLPGEDAELQFFTLKKASGIFQEVHLLDGIQKLALGGECPSEEATTARQGPRKEAPSGKGKPPMRQ